MANTKIPPQQVCRTCRQTLPASCFIKAWTGNLRRHCRVCSAEEKFCHRMRGKTAEEVQIAKDVRDARARIKEYSDAHPDEKWCPGGEHFRPLAAFSACSAKANGLQTYCKQCRRHQKAQRGDYYRGKAKEWRNQTKDERKKYGAIYYVANKSKLSERNKEYRTRNKWQLRLEMKKYYQKNKESHLRYSRKRYLAKREEILDKCHAYYRENKAAYKAYARLRASRRKNANGSFTAQQWQDKLAYWGYCCYLCGVSLHNQTIHLEHRTPLSRGGSNWIANIAPACANCNRRKHTKTESEFRALLAA